MSSARYKTDTGAEGEYQPGSAKRVLRNKLGIHRKTQMDKVESDALIAAQERYLSQITAATPFTVPLLCQMHRNWLGAIYDWAGQYRTVEMSKGGFRWPPAFSPLISQGSEVTLASRGSTFLRRRLRSRARESVVYQ